MGRVCQDYSKSKVGRFFFEAMCTSRYLKQLFQVRFQRMVQHHQYLHLESVCLHITLLVQERRFVKLSKCQIITYGCVIYETSLSLNLKIATHLCDKFYENFVQIQKLQAGFCSAVLVFTHIINTSCCSNENIELSIEMKKLTSTVQSFSIMS